MIKFENVNFLLKELKNINGDLDMTEIQDKIESLINIVKNPQIIYNEKARKNLFKIYFENLQDFNLNLCVKLEKSDSLMLMYGYLYLLSISLIMLETDVNLNFKLLNMQKGNLSILIEYFLCQKNENSQFSACIYMILNQLPQNLNEFNFSLQESEILEIYSQCLESILCNDSKMLKDVCKLATKAYISCPNKQVCNEYYLQILKSNHKSKNKIKITTYEGIKIQPYIYIFIKQIQGFFYGDQIYDQLIQKEKELKEINIFSDLLLNQLLLECNQVQNKYKLKEFLKDLVKSLIDCSYSYEFPIAIQLINNFIIRLQQDICTQENQKSKNFDRNLCLDIIKIIIGPLFQNFVMQNIKQKQYTLSNLRKKNYLKCSFCQTDKSSTYLIKHQGGELYICSPCVFDSSFDKTQNNMMEDLHSYPNLMFSLLQYQYNNLILQVNESDFQESLNVFNLMSIQYNNRFKNKDVYLGQLNRFKTKQIHAFDQQKKTFVNLLFQSFLSEQSEIKYSLKTLIDILIYFAGETWVSFRKKALMILSDFMQDLQEQQPDQKDIEIYTYMHEQTIKLLIGRCRDESSQVREKIIQIIFEKNLFLQERMMNIVIDRLKDTHRQIRSYIIDSIQCNNLFQDKVRENQMTIQKLIIEILQRINNDVDIIEKKGLNILIKLIFHVKVNSKNKDEVWIIDKKNILQISDQLIFVQSTNFKHIQTNFYDKIFEILKGKIEQDDYNEVFDQIINNFFIKLYKNQENDVYHLIIILKHISVFSSLSFLKHCKFLIQMIKDMEDNEEIQQEIIEILTKVLEKQQIVQTKSNADTFNGLEIYLENIIYSKSYRSCQLALKLYCMSILNPTGNISKATDLFKKSYALMLLELSNYYKNKKFTQIQHECFIRSMIITTILGLEFDKYLFQSLISQDSEQESDDEEFSLSKIFTQILFFTKVSNPDNDPKLNELQLCSLQNLLQFYEKYNYLIFHSIDILEYFLQKPESDQDIIKTIFLVFSQYLNKHRNEIQNFNKNRNENNKKNRLQLEIIINIIRELTQKYYRIHIQKNDLLSCHAIIDCLHEFCLQGYYQYSQISSDINPLVQCSNQYLRDKINQFLDQEQKKTLIFFPNLVKDSLENCFIYAQKYSNSLPYYQVNDKSRGDKISYFDKINEITRRHILENMGYSFSDILILKLTSIKYEAQNFKYMKYLCQILLSIDTFTNEEFTFLLENIKKIISKKQFQTMQNLKKIINENGQDSVFQQTQYESLILLMLICTVQILIVESNFYKSFDGDIFMLIKSMLIKCKQNINEVQQQNICINVHIDNLNDFDQLFDEQNEELELFKNNINVMIDIKRKLKSFFEYNVMLNCKSILDLQEIGEKIDNQNVVKLQKEINKLTTQTKKYPQSASNSKTNSEKKVLNLNFSSQNKVSKRKLRSSQQKRKPNYIFNDPIEEDSEDIQ